MEKYVDRKQIGEGAFGKAILVRMKDNGRQFVIKEINMKRMNQKERLEARKEVSVLAQLHHPNVVMYRESFEEIGNLYIVMDYCDGGDLYGRINSQRNILFQEDQILDWFVQTSLAVKHIHDRKILHRDIKSQNIFLTKHGIVKLGDFGIAKVLNGTMDLARTCIGTPYYLSPEICENRPYNNKSDVWSLGCVLYELTTLKHAFEAGNMKNLVLKIIRGSYPPPPTRYSYELRNLINLLFKRNPRDRPSITNVLRTPLLQTRIRKFLSESELADEFSHTVMHGVKVQKELPVGVAPRPLPPSPIPVKPVVCVAGVPAAKKPPSPVVVVPPSPRYDPAAVYGPSVARKSASKEKESRKSADVKKSADVRQSGGSVGGAKKQPAANDLKALPSPVNQNANQNNFEFAKKKQELVEKERRRKLENKKKLDEQQQQAYAKQHKELVDKQKVKRLQQAREEGWRNLMDSLSSDDASINSNEREAEELRPASVLSSPKQNEVFPTPALGGKDRLPAYEQYNAYLDKLEADRRGGERPHSAQGVAPARLGVAGALGYGAAPADVGFNAAAAQKFEAARANAAQDPEQAQVVKEFWLRKRAAELNKAKGQGLIGAGAAAAVGSPRPFTPIPALVPSAMDERNQLVNPEAQQMDYLSKLKQVRLQNFNERMMVQEKLAAKVDPMYKPPKGPADVKHDPELRRKKIEALRVQAVDRAKHLEAELDKKRKEMAELEQKRQNEIFPKFKNADNRPLPKPPIVAPKPEIAVSVTAVMRAIGAAKDETTVLTPSSQPETSAGNLVGLTAAMQAIGAIQDSSLNKESLQIHKNAILKRLNAKPLLTNDSSEETDRPKWGEIVKPVMAVEMGTENLADVDRLKWNTAVVPAAFQKTLEDATSPMEATSAEDLVIRHADAKANSPETKAGPASSATAISDEPTPDLSEIVNAARKQWGNPAGTVMNVLQRAKLAETFSKDDEKDVTDVATVGQAPSVGNIITVAHTPTKGTFVTKTTTNKECERGLSSNKDELARIGGEHKSSHLRFASDPALSRKDAPIHETSNDDKAGNCADSKSLSPSRKIPEVKSEPRLFNSRVQGDDKRQSQESGRARNEDDICVEDLTTVESPANEDAKSDASDDVKDEEEDEEDDDRMAIALLAKQLCDAYAEEHEDDLSGCEVKDEKTKKESQKNSSDVLFGLSTGCFDAADVKLLRTCSEPDMTKLFKCGKTSDSDSEDENPREQSPATGSKKKENSPKLRSAKRKGGKCTQDGRQNRESLDERQISPANMHEEKHRAPDLVSPGNTEKKSKDESKNWATEGHNIGEGDSNKDVAVFNDEATEEREQDDDDNDDDDGDIASEDEDGELLTLRQSMLELLNREDSHSGDEVLMPTKAKKVSKSKKSKKKSEKGTAKKKKKKKTMDDDHDSRTSVEAPAAVDASRPSAYMRNWSNGSFEDLQNICETMKSLLQPKKSPGKSRNPGAVAMVAKRDVSQPGDSSAGGDGKPSLVVAWQEDWQSDNDDNNEGSEDDDYFEEENMFSQLEATRERLEKELGCDTFLKAYKTVQAIHEDEDEDMQEGVKLVTQILGQEKCHLYPAILSLVMADGAFIEDNDG